MPGRARPGGGARGQGRGGSGGPAPSRAAAGAPSTSGRGPGMPGAGAEAAGSGAASPRLRALAQEARRHSAYSAVKAAAASAGARRVWAVSDIHVDYDQNMDWLHKMAREMPADCRLDAIIVAGDVSHDLRIMRKALSILKETFNSVYFVPGNHELWMKKDAEANGDASDSFEKLEKIEQLCEELDVLTRPAPFHGVWIAPLQSWHHQDWDTEPDIPNIPAVETRSSDYALCNFPKSEMGSLALAKRFDDLNDAHGFDWGLLEGETVISFSHMLPRQDLLPEKRFLFFPNLSKMVGSAPLQQRLERLRPQHHLHVFGHSHFSWDATLDGVRYVQPPLCYPTERKRRPRSLNLGVEGEEPDGSWLPMLLALIDPDTGEWAELPPYEAHWSDYYATSQRTPGVLELAPWVRKLYAATS